MLFFVKKHPGLRLNGCLLYLIWQVWKWQRSDCTPSQLTQKAFALLFLLHLNFFWSLKKNKQKQSNKQTKTKTRQIEKETKNFPAHSEIWAETAISSLQESCQPFRLKFQPTYWKHGSWNETPTLSLSSAAIMEQRTEKAAEGGRRDFHSRTQTAVWLLSGVENLSCKSSLPNFSIKQYVPRLVSQFLQHAHCLNRTHKSLSSFRSCGKRWICLHDYTQREITPIYAPQKMTSWYPYQES